MSQFSYCKVLIKCDPNLPGLKAILSEAKSQNFTPLINGTIEGSLALPFTENQSLMILNNASILTQVNISKLIFNNGVSEQQPMLLQINGNQHQLSLYFELQMSMAGFKSQLESLENSARDASVVLDLSVSGLPVKSNCFSCFTNLPLTFYQIINLSTNKILYESEITKAPSPDPFWMPSAKLSQESLNPKFRVTVLNSIDQEKSKKEVVGSVDIDYQELRNGGEFMYEIEGLEKTYVIIDRIQETQ